MRFVQRASGLYSTIIELVLVSACNSITVYGIIAGKSVDGIKHVYIRNFLKTGQR